MKTLSCPSCGGELTLPEGLTVAHCMYCGRKLVLDDMGSARERQQVTRLEELCKVALEARNYDDLAKYADQVLELDPRDASGWIYKAHVAFARSSAQDDRSEEANKYLKKAAEAAPSDERIAQVLTTWGPVICQLYLDAGVEYMNRSFNAIFQMAWGQVRQYKILAMQCNLKALHFAPQDRIVAILRAMQGLVQHQTKQDYVDYGPEVQAHLRGLDALDNRDSLHDQIHKLNRECIELRSELQDLQGKSGFMARRKIDQTEKRLAAVNGELERTRKAAASQDRVLEECRRNWGSAYSISS
jgi:tetratricopeptide (TPR) repeat protein